MRNYTRLSGALSAGKVDINSVMYFTTTIIFFIVEMVDGIDGAGLKVRLPEWVKRCIRAQYVGKAGRDVRRHHNRHTIRTTAIARRVYVGVGLGRNDGGGSPNGLLLMGVGTMILHPNISGSSSKPSAEVKWQQAPQTTSITPAIKSLTKHSVNWGARVRNADAATLQQGIRAPNGIIRALDLRNNNIWKLSINPYVVALEANVWQYTISGNMIEIVSAMYRDASGVDYPSMWWTRRVRGHSG